MWASLEARKLWVHKGGAHTQGLKHWDLEHVAVTQSTATVRSATFPPPGQHMQATQS